MKLLIIHNYHRKGSASGDDQVYKNEMALLKAHGHEVISYHTSNDEFDKKGSVGKMISTLGMIWSFQHYRAVSQLIQKEHPDLVHVHTFFPLLSPSILYAAKRCRVPVAATLHDTRFICPCATSLRGTEICNLCGDGHYMRMARYGCFKGSRLQSLIVAAVFRYHRIRRSFYRQIDGYICLNENQIHLLKEIGFDSSRIYKKYNFAEDQAEEVQNQVIPELPPRFALFYGRIGEEKGVRVLMQIWEQLPDIPLVVMGTGPLEQEFSTWAKAHPQVQFLGYVEHGACMSVVRQAEFVVFPSIWYEGCSMVEVETESMGKALVATDLGFSQEAVRDGYNGYKVPLGDVDGFASRIRTLWESPEECRRLGRQARQDYETHYQPEDNYLQLMEIYRKTLQTAGENAEG